MVSDPLVLSVDLDGVLVNFRAGFVGVAHELFHVSVPEQAPTRYWFRPYLTKDQERAVFHHISAEASFWAWLREEADAHAAKSLGRLSKAAQAGHLVYFVSHRPKIAWNATIDWLRAFGWTHGTPHVLLASDRGKGHVCRGLDVTHAIDDRVEPVEDMAAAGVTVACVSRSYNAEFSWPYRVESLPAWLDDLGL